ncbi:DNA mismatch repair protein MutL [Rubrobacter xylanophilus DSM 9941]|uniref:DNA mismatch repair endonuclease MutL n=1 Tax=Rubrobacter xylanophilus TaxID=49319 RepID=UPI001C642703|nr:DNA mismatch repair endonuclease MutL [Rubrobacter xylanophilus]QYJ16519.1 DNA mismatch repair protein MutL [Rubrobacter xylanophilus DSM 9941]
MRLFPRLLSEEPAGYGGGRVRILPPDVAHRIAAGEVIERPASAVKELVENSLDAGASRVEVEISGGGVSLIRVRDDGSGMTPEDAGRAVGRHATSKIRSVDDLSRVNTLGFRGEALHAIGAVSSLTLTTRPADGECGWRVKVLAGEPAGSGPTAHPPGTTVEVRDLFLNLPVRRGFLGTPRAEGNAVARAVEALALSRPEVGFSLRADGRPVLSLPPAANLRERVAQVHGLAVAGCLLPVSGPAVRGLVSPVSEGFPTRRYLHVTVNGRVVDPESFAPAVAKAYADLLPKGRHPAAFLRVELDPEEVDVNVHPAKRAVRLRGGRSAYPLVVGAVRAALELGGRRGGGSSPGQGGGGLSLIGQFAGRCIVAQQGDALLLIDQHGAHERVLYERLLYGPAEPPVSLEPPAVVRLPGGPLRDEVWAFESELAAAGFRLEPFGEDAVRVLAAPRGLGEVAAGFLGALEALAGGEDYLKALACRGADRFGEELDRARMARLLEDWASTRFPEICPHGRPIVRRIALGELLRGFGRA